MPVPRSAPGAHSSPPSGPPSAAPRRRPFRAATTLLTSIAVVALGLTAAAPASAAPAAAPAGSHSVTDAVFRWGVNNETNNSAFNGGFNLLSAGNINKVDAADLITEAEWNAANNGAGNVHIEKQTATGGTAPATWAGLRTDANGASTSPPTNNRYSGHQVVIDGGTGTVDTSAGTAEIQWNGTFTVAYYTGLTQFYVVDPKLTVEPDGTGTVTATLGGWGTDMTDTTKFVVLPEQPDTVIASLSGVELTDTGITVTPDYLGVQITPPADQPDQVLGNATSGSFPQSFVNFQALTGQAPYWYSSGGSTDKAKPMLPLSVSYSAAPTEPEKVPASITTQPAAASVADGATASFAVTAAGDAPLSYQWQRSGNGTDWANIDGANAATYAFTATAADNGASFRVIVDNAAAKPVTSDPAALTVAAKPTIEVTGAQLEWAYTAYAQYGVFGPWSQKANGKNVSLTTTNGKTVTGNDVDKDTDFTLVRFDGGTGTLDEATGAGTITWADTGDWVINAYSGQFGAPDETLRKPILTINPDGTGSLSFEAYIPAAVDMSGNPTPAVGPTRITTVTLSKVTVKDGVISVVPDYAGRTYSVDGVVKNTLCDGIGGAWPTDWINFVPSSVRTHYYTTSCTGLNLKKPTLPFTVSIQQTPAEISTQPKDVTADEGKAATFTVNASGNPISYQWQRSSDGTDWADVQGATDRTLSVTTAAADTDAKFRVVVAGTVTSDTVTLTVVPKPVVLNPVEHATFEWGINAVSQGASANGACSYFVAGIADGTDASYKTKDGDVVLIKRAANGAAIEVTKENRCTPIENGDARQRVLFTNGTGTTNPETGETVIQWKGSFTVYSYGGLVPWSVTDPKLTIDAAGNGVMKAELSGFAASMADPNVKVPLPPEKDMTILNLKNVSISGDTITSTPVYAGVDYHRLIDANDPNSGREAASAIPDEAKAANPNWGSWPTDMVDFQYRSGLSSYWHTSGLSADPQKPPMGVGLSLDGGVPPYTTLEPITVTKQPKGVSLVTGKDTSFSVEATSKQDLHYQWMQTPDGYTWTNIPGATSATYSVTNAPATTDATYVKVRITNDGLSVDSDSARFRVNAQTLLVEEYPVGDETVFAGSDLYLSAYFSGFPDPSYTPQLSSDGGKTWTDLAPAQDYSNYQIPNIPESYDGSLYRLLVTNGYDTVESKPASLHVLPKPSSPTLAVAPESLPGSGAIDPAVETNVYIRGGGFPDPTADVTVAVVPTASWNARGATYTAPDAVWKNDIQSQWNFTKGYFTFVPTIEPGLLDPNVAYSAVVFNKNTTDRSYDAGIVLPIIGQGAPTITAQPTNVTAPVTPATGDATASFTVAATGTPSPQISWQKRFGTAEWTTIDGAEAATLNVAYTASDNGTSYRAVVTNGLGSSVTSDAAKLTVGTAPAITSQPIAASVLPKQTATYSVGVAGDDAAVQWQRLDAGSSTWKDLAGETKTTLNVTAAKTDDGAAFRAVVTGSIPTEINGSVFSVTSAAAGLTVQTTAIAITKQPASWVAPVTPVTGPATVSFGIEATAQPALKSIQWQRLIGSTWTDVVGATESVYAFAYTETDSGSQFRAVVTNTADESATSHVATLTVGTPAVITAQPASVTAVDGTKVDFTVAFAGTGTTVRWQSLAAGASTWTDVAGATGTTLQVPAVLAVSGTAYRAVVTGTIPTEITDASLAGISSLLASEQAVLTVTVPATITTQPGSITAPVAPVAGSPVARFTVGVAGSPVPTVTWERQIAGGEWTSIDGASGAVLDVAYTAADNGNQYRAVVTNGVGETIRSNAATLTVGEQAAIAGQPTAVTVASGADATFTVEVSGSPAPAVQWQKQALGSTSWTDVQGATGTTLTVASADVRGGESYRAVVSNPIPTTVGGTGGSSVTSSAAAITLTAPASAPKPLTDEQLNAATPNTTVTIDGITGSTVVVNVGAKHAGQFVGATVYSTPQWLGWNLVDASGTVTLTLPEGLPAGDHRIAIVDASGALIGVATFTVTVTVNPDGTTTSTAKLASTGADPVLPILGAALFLIAGAWLAVSARRRREQGVLIG
ncbi:beta strand repeat-containing protein [Plantibacter sp. YIM 135249]|uniref:beta strand repeat-containing protein n=1 Tax=Plantibacter sp. YIM 135249 TaxID=3423918 RepID=UPI003D34E062